MKPNKAILGVFTFLPFIAGIVLLIWGGAIMLDFISQTADLDDVPEEEVLRLLFGDFLSIMLLSIIISIVSFGVTIYYIVLALKNNSLSDGMKIMWVVLLFLFAGIANIVYYFVEVMPEKPESTEQAA